MKCCFIPLKDGMKRLQWDITYKCNLKCMHCCASADENRENKSYTMEEITEIIRILKENNVGKVSLSGGEPTLCKQLEDIVRELYKAEIKVGLVTNLYYDINKILPILDYINSITTSIDGSEDIHNEIRGKKCYKQSVDNISKLVEYGKDIKVIITIHDKNYSFLEEVVEKLVSRGVKNIMFANISWEGRAIENKEKLYLTKTDSEIKAFLQYLVDKFKINIVQSECSYKKSKELNKCLAGKKYSIWMIH